MPSYQFFFVLFQVVAELRPAKRLKHEKVIDEEKLTVSFGGVRYGNFSLAISKKFEALAKLHGSKI